MNLLFHVTYNLDLQKQLNLAVIVVITGKYDQVAV